VYSCCTVLQAVSGKNIILPCFPKFDLSVGHDILEWHFYEKEIYTFEKKGLVQEEKYNNRLFTSTEELEKGNASIQLCDVKESDAGEYLEAKVMAVEHFPQPSTKELMRFLVVGYYLGFCKNLSTVVAPLSNL
uniref:Uncharacterized protein n=1 Tax=Neolamprologus brichardi TaxID=32507 RepID=A0A3Q4M5B1_NEOBR